MATLVVSLNFHLISTILSSGPVEHQYPSTISQWFSDNGGQAARSPRHISVHLLSLRCFLVHSPPFTTRVRLNLHVNCVPEVANQASEAPLRCIPIPAFHLYSMALLAEHTLIQITACVSVLIRAALFPGAVSFLEACSAPTVMYSHMLDPTGVYKIPYSDWLLLKGCFGLTTLDDSLQFWIHPEMR